MPKTTGTTKKRKNSKKEEIPVQTDHNPVIIQLPLQLETIQHLIEADPIIQPLEYTPNIMEPEPYLATNCFISINDTLQYIDEVKPQQNIEHVEKETKTMEPYKNCCYWCCHPIEVKEFGMPIKYDAYYKTFTTFGHFCSLECVAAHNFASHNGSDRMWEIHSWIQMIAQQIGFEVPIRPAPSRFLLKMFNGPLDINDFRLLHKSPLRTYIMNMPPMIHVLSQMEILNTSFVSNKNNITTTENTHDHKSRISRKRAVVDIKKALDSKMNLTITTVEDQ